MTFLVFFHPNQAEEMGRLAEAPGEPLLLSRAAGVRERYDKAADRHLDTTLRDGTQGEGISLTVHDKLHITEMLDDFGVHLIEGGWPGSNPKDIEYFQAVRDLDLTHARIAAFGSTCRPSLAPEDDDNLRALLESEAPVATIFGKSWIRHVTQVLRTDADNNLR